MVVGGVDAARRLVVVVVGDMAVHGVVGGVDVARRLVVVVVGDMAVVVAVGDRALEGPLAVLAEIFRFRTVVAVRSFCVVGEEGTEDRDHVARRRLF